MNKSRKRQSVSFTKHGTKNWRGGFRQDQKMPKFKRGDRVRVLPTPEGFQFVEAGNARFKHAERVHHVGVVLEVYVYGPSRSKRGGRDRTLTYLVVFEPGVYVKDGEIEIQEDLLEPFWAPDLELYTRRDYSDYLANL